MRSRRTCARASGACAATSRGRPWRPPSWRRSPTPPTPRAGSTSAGWRDYLAGNVAGIGRALVVVALLAAALLRDRRPRAAAGARRCSRSARSPPRATRARPTRASRASSTTGCTSSRARCGSAGSACWCCCGGRWCASRAAARAVAIAREVLAPFGRDRGRRVPRRGLDRAGRARHPARPRRRAVGHAPTGALLAVKIVVVGLIAAASFVHARRLRPRLLARTRSRRAGRAPPLALWRSEPWLGAGGRRRGRGPRRLPAAAAPARPGRRGAGRGLRSVPAAPPGRRRARRGRLGRLARGRGLDPPHARRRSPARCACSTAAAGRRDVPVELRRRAPASCGDGLPALPAAGGRARTVDVAVRERGRRYAAALPARWDAGGSRARAGAARARRAHDARACAACASSSGSRAGPAPARAPSTACARPTGWPGRPAAACESVVIGRRQWIRTPGRPWREGQYGSGLAFKTRSWFAWRRYARDGAAAGRARAAGAAELALMDEGTPVWFRLTMDLATHRVLREQMIARARFADTRFIDFGSRFAIEAPEDGLTRARSRPGARRRCAAAARRRHPRRRRVRGAARLRADDQGRRTARSTTRSRAARRSPRRASTLARARRRQPVRRRGGRLAAGVGDGDVALDELRGTPVVLNFWASWCDPCRAEAEVLQQGWEDTRRRRAVPRPRRPGRLGGRARLHLPVRPHVPARARPRRTGRPGVGRHRPARDVLPRRRRPRRRPRDRLASEQQLREGVAAARAGGAAQGGEQRRGTRRARHTPPRAATRRSPSRLGVAGALMGRDQQPEARRAEGPPEGRARARRHMSWVHVRTCRGRRRATRFRGAEGSRSSMKVGLPHPHGPLDARSDLLRLARRGRRRRPPETLAYVVDAQHRARNGDRAPDALAVLDLEPGSPTYGQLVGRLDMPERRRRAAPLRLERLLVGAVPVGAAPARRAPLPARARACAPRASTSSTSRPTRAQPEARQGRSRPRRSRARPATAARTPIHCGPDGIYVSALGAPDGDGPGGIFLLDHDDFEVKGAWEDDRGPQELAYDFWWHLGHDTMITSEWGTPNMVEDGLRRRAAARRQVRPPAARLGPRQAPPPAGDRPRRRAPDGARAAAGARPEQGLRLRRRRRLDRRPVGLGLALGPRRRRHGARPRR